MKAIILAGGQGSRMGHGKLLPPKPLIRIGNLPVLIHIMKIYSHYNVKEFIICCGYKKNMIRDYFRKYTKNKNIDFKKNKTFEIKKKSELWKITIVDTGINTMTGGRVKKISKYIDNESFCLCYGDDLKNVNISRSIAFHKKQKKIGTMTIMHHPERFGIVTVKNKSVKKIIEKPIGTSWINGGYYIFEPKIFEYIKDSKTVLEKEPLQKLIKKNNLTAFSYNGKYQPLDTLKDKNDLEKMWKTNQAYWKVSKD